jgi:hypothetical protein
MSTQFSAQGSGATAVASVPGSVSRLGSPVALQLPSGFPLSQNNDYLVDTDGWVVGVVSGDYEGGQQWGALSVSYTAADGTAVAATASGANTAATGTVMDSSSSSLTVPIPNGTTFTLQFWGGKYGAPACQAWFVPVGQGTATLQSS